MIGNFVSASSFQYVQPFLLYTRLENMWVKKYICQISLGNVKNFVNKSGKKQEQENKIKGTWTGLSKEANTIRHSKTTPFLLFASIGTFKDKVLTEISASNGFRSQ